ncbi:hypothetical protein ACRALDRAFT_212334 [Sodiomyces alcalophilus JCM 7366]|uniref:uncharacterized protein n=1 Tax=Sodiomyces alcalophilus JCM 7366 TaxID=591952 RepID=UPI0039B50D96
MGQIGQSTTTPLLAHQYCLLVALCIEGNPANAAIHSLKSAGVGFEYELVVLWDGHTYLYPAGWEGWFYRLLDLPSPGADDQINTHRLGDVYYRRAGYEVVCEYLHLTGQRFTLPLLFGITIGSRAASLDTQSSTHTQHDMPPTTCCLSPPRSTRPYVVKRCRWFPLTPPTPRVNHLQVSIGREAPNPRPGEAKRKKEKEKGAHAAEKNLPARKRKVDETFLGGSKGSGALAAGPPFPLSFALSRDRPRPGMEQHARRLVIYLEQTRSPDQGSRHHKINTWKRHPTLLQKGQASQYPVSGHPPPGTPPKQIIEWVGPNFVPRREARTVNLRRAAEEERDRHRTRLSWTYVVCTLYTRLEWAWLSLLNAPNITPVCCTFSRHRPFEDRVRFALGKCNQTVPTSRSAWHNMGERSKVKRMYAQACSQMARTIVYRSEGPDESIVALSETRLLRNSREEIRTNMNDNKTIYCAIDDISANVAGGHHDDPEVQELDTIHRLDSFVSSLYCKIAKAVFSAHIYMILSMQKLLCIQPKYGNTITALFYVNIFFLTTPSHQK